MEVKFYNLKISNKLRVTPVFSKQFYKLEFLDLCLQTDELFD